ncbi:MAG TPA: filamentous hemagglutinin N-terminal domain-containing protein, partial [Sedimentisphaerales bacterium]|nr:filamentous hemagglutinin N-terminal domain-containing protein [Sedimentisphaerales bacterium]
MWGLRRFSRKNSFRHAVAWFLMGCILFNTWPSVALAGPENPQVVNGQVSFEQSGYNTTITASDKSIINYSGFDIARPEIVRFIQPGSQASVLNRILSANPTHIDGTLLANGRVFFINPAGVYFGSTALVNVNQLVASALDISNSDFVNGRLNFIGGKGSVVNAGTIFAEKVSLIGKQIANSGSINCAAGYVVLAAGDRVFLGEVGSNVVLEIDAPSLSEPAAPVDPGPGVLNEGTIEAPGGKIVLAAAGDIYSQAISNVGTLSASVQTGDAGEVKLVATEGTVTNSGRIEATSNDGKGGTVEVLGDRVGLLEAAEIDVSGSTGGGEVLIGGDYQGSGDIPTASRTYVSADSSIKADAIDNGDGGKVIVWADDTTAFYGNISARGGSEGGDGGFAEVSGHNLIYRGHSDLGAPAGSAGTLLLDPDKITIQGGTADGDDSESVVPPDPALLLEHDGTGIVSFAASPSDFTVYESEIENTNANIVLEADSGISTSGTFDFDAGSGSGVLELLTGNSLTLSTQNPTGETTGIDLTTSTEMAGLEIKTQGSGSITIETGVAGVETAPIALCKLTAGGGITIDAKSATGTTDTVDIGGAMNAGGPIQITGSAITASVDITGNGITLTGPVTADKADLQTINAGAGTLQANGTIDRTTADGLALAGGSVNLTDQVTLNDSAFTSTGGTFNNTGAIITGGPIAINHTGTVTLGADLDPGVGNRPTGNSGLITVASNAAQIQDALDIAVAGATVTVQADSYAEDVSVDKSLTLSVPSGTATMTTLTSDAAKTTDLSGSFAADGTTDPVFWFKGAVTLAGDVWLTSTNNKNITFDSTVSGTSLLDVTTGGITKFADVVGGSGAALTSLTTDSVGDTELWNNITTSGAQTYNDDVDLKGDVIATSTG